MKKIRYTVKRGKSVGAILTPHYHEGNYFVVSQTRFEKDYIRIKDENELLEWLLKGYSIRMSNPRYVSHRSPSLISPSSIEIYEL